MVWIFRDYHGTFNLNHILDEDAIIGQFIIAMGGNHEIAGGNEFYDFI